MAPKRNKILTGINLASDTNQRLKQYAAEKHTNVSQAITDWIWSIKLPSEILAEQERELKIREMELQKHGSN